MAMLFPISRRYERRQVSGWPTTVSAACALALWLAAFQCSASWPVDPAAPADVLLSIQFETDAPLRSALPDLAVLAQRRLTQRRTISNANANADASSAPSLNQSIESAGVSLRDVIASAPGYQ